MGRERVNEGIGTLVGVTSDAYAGMPSLGAVGMPTQASNMAPNLTRNVCARVPDTTDKSRCRVPKV
jgi:hypothetical protein